MSDPQRHEVHVLAVILRAHRRAEAAARAASDAWARVRDEGHAPLRERIASDAAFRDRFDRAGDALRAAMHECTCAFRGIALHCRAAGITRDEERAVHARLRAECEALGEAYTPFVYHADALGAVAA